MLEKRLPTLSSGLLIIMRKNMTATPSGLRVLLVLFSLAVAWLPSRVSGTTGIGHAYLAPRIGHRRAPASASSSVWRRSNTIACMNHGAGAAALGWPFTPGRGRGSTRPRGGPPMLWALVCAAGLVVATSTNSVVSQLLLASEGENGEGGAGAGNKVGTAMISFIKAYKKELSPLIPPACRFLPTCSVYGVEAIEKFGPTKGAILTAWRLMRCNPFAGYGIDHPQWPPPGWFAGEKW